MVLVNDAVWTLAKGLKHLDLFEEIELPQVQCKKGVPWPFGKRIVEQIKAVSVYYPWIQVCGDVLGTTPVNFERIRSLTLFCIAESRRGSNRPY